MKNEELNLSPAERHAEVALTACLVTIITMGLSYWIYQNSHIVCKRPACDFQVGDLVEHRLHGQDGIILWLNPEKNLVTVRWKLSDRDTCLPLLCQHTQIYDVAYWELEHD